MCGGTVLETRIQEHRARRVLRGGRAFAWAVAAAIAVPLLLGAGAGEAVADLGDYRCNDPGRVYHGNPRLIRQPAAILADQVFAQIPEYQEIIRDGLTDRDVRYHFLMKEASKKFAKAVKAMARTQRHDFVAEQGAIEVVREGAPEPPDRTSDVIAELG